MRKICLFTILFLLVGCTTSPPNSSTPLGFSSLESSATLQPILSTPGPPGQVAVATASSTPSALVPFTLRPTITATRTVATTPTRAIVDFPTPFLGDSVQQQCLPIEGALPGGVAPTGTLILSTNPFDLYGGEGEVYLLDLQSREMQLMFRTQKQSDLTPTVNRISPNRQWYISFEPPASGVGNQLHIRSIDGKDLPIAYWDEMWGNSAEWLDNQRLIVRPSDDWLNGTLIILNLFTGEWQKLIPNEHVASFLSHDSPLIYYNPSLTQAIYQSGDSIYILWDVQTQTDIWMRQGANFLVRPGWAPTENQFAMVITNYSIRQSDIFLVTSDGQETQLTHLAEAYPSMPQIYIEDMAWSPDGQHIAFLVSMEDNIHEIKKATLMVVDIATHQVTDYCIAVSRYSGGYIVWSPTSEQLVIASPVDYQEYIETAPKGVKPRVRVILVDIANGFAAQIAEDLSPMGWMVSP